MTTKPQPARAKRGPKPKRETAAITFSVRLTPARREKFRQLGGSDWLSDLLDAATLPHRSP